jgi:sulfoxide reductase heme-binding subunit YedZ
LIVLVVCLCGLCLLTTVTFIFSPALQDMVQSNLNSIFGINTQQIWWFVTRAAGLIAYLLLWFSTVWGLAVPSKLVAPILEQTYTFDFHQFISLLSIGFTLLHVIVLMIDQYLPFSIWQILLPFLDSYRPFWVGIGIISFYIILLVTITFYIRSRIGMPAFRVIHILSLASYLGATVHGLFAGTDGTLPGQATGSGYVPCKKAEQQTCFDFFCYNKPLLDKQNAHSIMRALQKGSHVNTTQQALS